MSTNANTQYDAAKTMRTIKQHAQLGVITFKEARRQLRQVVTTELVRHCDVPTAEAYVAVALFIDELAK